MEKIKVFCRKQLTLSVSCLSLPQGQAQRLGLITKYLRLEAANDAGQEQHGKPRAELDQASVRQLSSCPFPSKRELETSLEVLC